jgi:hypothetical protein
MVPAAQRQLEVENIGKKYRDLLVLARQLRVLVRDSDSSSDLY